MNHSCSMKKIFKEVLNLWFFKHSKKGKRDGKQRYYCTECFNNFTSQNSGVSKSNQFVWFQKWIMERQVYKFLIRDRGMSQSKLQRLFNEYLKSPPKNSIRSKTNVH